MCHPIRWPVLSVWDTFILQKGTLFENFTIASLEDIPLLNRVFSSRDWISFTSWPRLRRRKRAELVSLKVYPLTFMHLQTCHAHIDNLFGAHASGLSCTNPTARFIYLYQLFVFFPPWLPWSETLGYCTGLGGFESRLRQPVGWRNHNGLHLCMMLHFNDSNHRQIGSVAGRLKY